ncbi:MAG TPA: Mur ligase family protein [Clostridia bacterium]|nr:Mur ligase family protein [Clostridia bacterium]
MGLLNWLTQNKNITEASRIISTYSGLRKIAVTEGCPTISVKAALKTMLWQRFKTVAIPESYATTLSIAKAVKSALDNSIEFLIAEARPFKHAEMKEFCEMIRPDFVLVTSYKDSYADTLFPTNSKPAFNLDMFDMLPKNSILFLLSNNSDCLKIYNKTKLEKYLYGDGSSVKAVNIAVTKDGTEFLLTGPEGQVVQCRTVLLGKNNIDCIVGCAALCYKLGLTDEEIAKGISMIKPIKQRLELKYVNGVTIIDDTKNSDPHNANIALEVLGEFSRNRIIVSPGFSKSGTDREAEHLAYGNLISKKANIAILIGPWRTSAIKEGMLNSGFFGRIETVMSTKEAFEFLKTIAKPGDTVLLENELPDSIA